MLSRNINYVWKLGEYALWEGTNNNPPIKFVGGSPVKIHGANAVANGFGQEASAPPMDAMGKWDITVEGCDDVNYYFGVAYHSYDAIKRGNQMVAVVKAPAIIEIYKGKEKNRQFQMAEEFYPYGFGEDDQVAPFDTNVTYAVGDLLVPGKVKVGGDTYAVWTKLTPAAGVNVAYARVLAFLGTGADTVLQIELGTFVVNA